ncbi:putative pectinesterase/pectinesterase inhibitor 34 [Hibiscus syriacus]|uniref:Pectinesterase n=1 Tax=Hibiscus syriacus TaxID=106335 RepID=A0A6A2ZT47_HIBSY|nr:putative pectinesterase/pectinesterase inhibitor 34 [Hibiscus syriacus]
MGYDRIRPSESGHGELTAKNNKKNVVIIPVVALTMIIVSAVCAGVVVVLREGGGAPVGTSIRRKLTQAISRTCGKTRFRKLSSFNRALYTTSFVSVTQMDPRVRSAYDDCLELLEDSVDALSRSLSSVVPSQKGHGKGGSTQDVMTWLSAALTNQDTCTEGFEGLSGAVRDQMTVKLADLLELVSNCLSIFAASGGVPTQNRRLLTSNDVVSAENTDERHFPKWLRREERAMLDTPVTAIWADIIVSKDGNGTVNTITEAIKKAPEHSTRRIIIYVKAGSCNRCCFIARDITFQNWAGPAKHQAVALRIGADHAVVYRCNIIGYQDTLYVHSNRQFYRECDIYGTVDFIFGNAGVVFQNCSIYARKPMPLQKNTITAQNRKDPNQNIGISIHACRILPTPDLAAAKGSFQTYLGRPWKLYSTAVFMLSYISDHIHSRGWLEWNAAFALDTLHYAQSIPDSRARV